jgi:hypothetical protein
MNDAPRPYPANRPLNTAAFLRVIAACWILGLAMALFAQFPWLVEQVYAQGVGIGIARALSWLTAWYPYSLGELIMLAGYTAIPGGLIVVSVQCLRKRRQWRNGLARYGLWFIAIAHAALVVFYGVWGLNYSRADVFERQGWERLATGDDAPGAVDELAALCGELVSATNEAYIAAMGSEDAGEPSRPSMSLRELDANIEAALDRMAVALDMPRGFQGRRGPAKPWLGSWVFTKLGITGMYFPWTGEAQINMLPPWSGRPHTIAHEKAHQRAITSEAEANFVGFLGCIYSDDPYVRYSGLLFAQRQLLGVLSRADRDRAQEIARARIPGITRDLEANGAFWAQHRGPAQAAGRAFNDAYLRANRVEGGVQSYGMSAELLVLLAREQGGTLLTPEYAQVSGLQEPAE